MSSKKRRPPRTPPPQSRPRAAKAKAPAARGGGKDTFPSTVHRFKPGQSGNPEGRTTAGATVREWWNALAEKALTPRELLKIVRDPDAPFPKIQAALQVLDSIEHADVADMEPMLDGKMTLQEMRQAGVNTRAIRKVKVKRTILYNKGEAEGEEVTREVELHNRAGGALDRIVEHTDGRPKQQVDLTSDDKPLRTPADGAVEAAAILAELGLAAGPAGPRPKP